MGKRIFSTADCPDWLCDPKMGTQFRYRGYSGRGVKLTTRLRLAPRLSISRYLPRVLPMPSWRGHRFCYLFTFTLSRNVAHQSPAPEAPPIRQPRLHIVSHSKQDCTPFSYYSLSSFFISDSRCLSFNDIVIL